MKTLQEYIKTYHNESTDIQEVPFAFPPHEGEAKALFYNVADKRVFAFIGYPSTPAPKDGYPAVVLVHGGEGQAFYEWVFEWTKRGFVAIAADYDSQYAIDVEHRKEPNLDCGIKGYGSTFAQNLSEEHPWVYFSVLETIKAVDLLSADSRVNAEKIMIDGISWGGFLSLIVCGVEKRLQAGIINYSSAFISEGNWGQENMELKKLSQAQLQEYNEHFDPQSYLKNIQIPMLFSAGMQDVCFFVKERMKTTQQISGKKYYSYRRWFNHGHYEVFAEAVNYAFADHVLRNAPFFDMDTAQKGAFSIQKTAVVYTCKNVKALDIVEWEEVENMEDLPTNTQAYFVSYELNNGIKVSSDIHFE